MGFQHYFGHICSVYLEDLGSGFVKEKWRSQQAVEDSQFEIPTRGLAEAGEDLGGSQTGPLGPLYAAFNVVQSPQSHTVIALYSPWIEAQWDQLIRQPCRTPSNI